MRNQPESASVCRMSENTGDVLMSLARHLRRAYARDLEQWDITPSQSRALRIVGEHQPVRLSVLADVLRIAPRSATEVVDVLEDRGWVLRTADPTDRRATCLTLTEGGAAQRDLIERARSRTSEQFLDVLPERERRTLDRILRTLHTRTMGEIA